MTTPDKRSIPETALFRVNHGWNSLEEVIPSAEGDDGVYKYHRDDIVRELQRKADMADELAANLEKVMMDINRLFAKGDSEIVSSSVKEVLKRYRGE